MSDSSFSSDKVLEVCVTSSGVLECGLRSENCSSNKFTRRRRSSFRCVACPVAWFVLRSRLGRSRRRRCVSRTRQELVILRAPYTDSKRKNVVLQRKLQLSSQLECQWVRLGQPGGLQSAVLPYSNANAGVLRLFQSKPIDFWTLVVLWLRTGCRTSSSSEWLSPRSSSSKFALSDHGFHRVWSG